MSRSQGATGIAGAPKFGDKAAWAPRIAQGVSVLYTHAIGGFHAGVVVSGADTIGLEPARHRFGVVAADAVDDRRLTRMAP